MSGLVAEQNIPFLKKKNNNKTAEQEVSICLKTPENCRLFDSFGPFQFSNVSLTVVVISFGFWALSVEEIKS